MKIGKYTTLFGAALLLGVATPVIVSTTNSTTKKIVTSDVLANPTSQVFVKDALVDNVSLNLGTFNTSSPTTPLNRNTIKGLANQLFDLDKVKSSATADSLASDYYLVPDTGLVPTFDDYSGLTWNSMSSTQSGSQYIFTARVWVPTNGNYLLPSDLATPSSFLVVTWAQQTTPTPAKVDIGRGFGLSAGVNALSLNNNYSTYLASLDPIQMNAGSDTILGSGYSVLGSDLVNNKYALYWLKDDFFPSASTIYWNELQFTNSSTAGTYDDVKGLHWVANSNVYGGTLVPTSNSIHYNANSYLDVSFSVSRFDLSTLSTPTSNFTTEVKDQFVQNYFFGQHENDFTINGNTISGIAPTDFNISKNQSNTTITLSLNTSGSTNATNEYFIPSKTSSITNTVPLQVDVSTSGTATSNFWLDGTFTNTNVINLGSQTWSYSPDWTYDVKPLVEAYARNAIKWDLFSIGTEVTSSNNHSITLTLKDTTAHAYYTMASTFSNQIVVQWSAIYVNMQGGNN